MGYATPIGDALATGWGIALLIVAGFLCLIYANHRQRPRQGADSAAAESEAAPPVSVWDDPGFRFEVVNKKTFRRERVPLDGILYTNCTFEDVTFVYEGEKPYGLVAFKIVGKDTDVEAASAPVSAFSRLLHVLGYIKREIEVGDELRPDSQVVRVEGGQVDVLESADEERERLRTAEKRAVQKPNPRSPEELKALCRHVARDLTAFDHKRRGVPGDATDEDIRRRDEETVRLYHEQHKPRIMDLYNELAPRGWFYKGDREQFENVNDWGNVQFAAERLRAICRSFAGD